MSQDSGEGGTTMRRLQHELRTPLGHIIGYSEMLREELEDRGIEDLAPDLERIREAAGRLLGLVEGVFRAEAAEPVPPVAAADTAPQGEAAASDRVEPGAEGRILVVDDEPGNRDLLARRLTRAGHSVACASDGTTALRCIEDEEFDLVLLDVMMPDLDGLEVLARIRATREPTDLPVVMATALDRSADVARALRRGANDYVTKPFDMPVVLARVATHLQTKRARHAILTLARRLELRNVFIRRTFGRYVSDEVADSLLESVEGLEIRGEKREISILNADLRGFSSLTESLPPTDVVSILNNHLSTMVRVIEVEHRGTIGEFLGDGILAFFGAPVAAENDAERAVACALAMQLAMEEVNARNRERGLPEIEMGIGIATGQAIVGNLGSETRTKYGAVGTPVNLSARIESYTLGGEILIDETTRRGLGELVHIDRARAVHPKGFTEPLRIHRVRGLGGEWQLELPEAQVEFWPLAQPLPARAALLEGKDVAREPFGVEIVASSASGARLRSTTPVAELADIRLELGEGAEGGASCYAKVVEGSDGEGLFTIRLTSRSPALEAALSAAR
jgi:class 3 adenylate cyclase/CheY-like chemotaxis protein